jgi:hypothetical protein
LNLSVEPPQYSTLISPADDGIVVVRRPIEMSDRMSVADYLRGAETLRRRELEWGVLRDAPSPIYLHQALVTRLAVLLDGHARPRAPLPPRPGAPVGSAAGPSAARERRVRGVKRQRPINGPIAHFGRR